jgi:hypothetical protein
MPIERSISHRTGLQTPLALTKVRQFAPYKLQNTAILRYFTLDLSGVKGQSVAMRV